MTLNDLYDLLLPPSTPLWIESIDAQSIHLRRDTLGHQALSATT
jgi:hypothetical protein